MSKKIHGASCHLNLLRGDCYPKRSTPGSIVQYKHDGHLFKEMKRAFKKRPVSSVVVVIDGDTNSRARAKGRDAGEPRYFCGS